MNNSTISFFVFENRLEKITKLGDRQENLRQSINWNRFSDFLESRLPRSAEKPQGGRPAYSHDCMFRILVLQTLHNLSDDEMEFMLNDRLSFQKFIGRLNEVNMPDAKTIWIYREQLKNKNLIKPLFKLFHRELKSNFLTFKRGSIVDATFIEVPKQRNSREENKTIKNGEIPEDWKDDRNKLRQKDINAKWMKKNDETHYGYKDHVKTDAETKIITNYEVTSAEVHDSQKIFDLLEKDDKATALYADSAYKSERIDWEIKKRKIENKIHEKGYRNKKLNKRQIASNTKKSKTRVRIEHVFAFISKSMKGTFIRTIGIARAACKIGMMNLVYNMCLVIQIFGPKRVRSALL
jgi:transposase, IS5 family